MSLGIMGAEFRPPLKSLKHHSTMVPTGLRGALDFGLQLAFWYKISFRRICSVHDPVFIGVRYLSGVMAI